MKQLLLHELRPVMLFLATFRTSGPESGQPVLYQRKPIPSLSPSLLKFALMGTFPISMASQLLADPLEQGKIPFVKVGTHRRIRYSDLMNYKKQRDAERERGLDEIAQMSQDLGLYD